MCSPRIPVEVNITCVPYQVSRNSSPISFLILSNIDVFQLSSLVTWSNSYTAAVKASWSPLSKASTKALTNLASRVEENVTSWLLYFCMFRLAVTVS